MAIRMRPDEDNGGRQQPNIPPQNPRRGGGGRGGLLTALLPMFLSLFRRNPKMALMLLVIGGAIYFFSGGLGNLLPSVDDSQANASFSSGLEMNPAKYGNTNVYEPLADNRKNPMPEKTSLLEYAPQRRNQGQQGSCVGWSASYAARSILHKRATGQDTEFSPSYLYNQIALKNCNGTYLPDALAVMKKGGVLPFEYFPYDESSCSKQPSSNEKAAAKDFRIRDYYRLTEGRSSGQKADMLGIKQNLAQGAPVVIGMMVGGTFMRAMQGRDVWMPTRADYNMGGYSGHAMCVIGYDDYKEGGAFQIMNSWGSEWGNNGVAWVRYADFKHFTKEAYGLYPMGSTDTESDNFVVQFGVVKNKGKINVAFKQSGENTFRTVTPMKKGEDFKIEVTNSVNCYIYVFGQETNGNIYTLFPYDKKHSPFCGIKGTRLFPRDQSMYPDEDGDLDYMSVLVTKEPVDYVQVAQALNQGQGTFSDKFDKILSGQLMDNLQFETGKTITLGTRNSNKQAAYIVMEIDKE